MVRNLNAHTLDFGRNVVDVRHGRALSRFPEAAALPGLKH
jgi:hypothetical protein